MKRFIFVALVAAALVLPSARAQQEAKKSTSPVSDTVRDIVARQAKNMVAAVEQMPPDKFSYHPTPEQMTFAHLVVHMVESNNFLCSKIAGTAAPEATKLSDSDAKDKLVGALKTSFDYCTQTLEKTDDSGLGDSVTLSGGRTFPRARAMIALTNDFADHYGMAAMYLRLNGLLPPTAQPQKKQ
ncbi:MAG: DinB family protein [Candidatus Acidiferrales bacterium]|jgi:uncharacterized damage-inducible protein DinB